MSEPLTPDETAEALRVAEEMFGRGGTGMSELLDALLAQAYSRGLNDALRQMRAIDLAANTLDLDSPETDLRTRIEALLDRWQADGQGDLVSATAVRAELQGGPG